MRCYTANPADQAEQVWCWPPPTPVAPSLTVRGKASHSGIAPHDGRNALMELAFQLLQAQDLSVPARGIQLNWTLAKAGSARNTIPDLATAEADVRVGNLANFNRIEQDLVAAVTKKHLIPDTVVEARFERRRPPLEPTAGANRRCPCTLPESAKCAGRDRCEARLQRTPNVGRV